MDQLNSSTLLQPPLQLTTTPTPATKLHDFPSTNMDHAKTPNGDSNVSSAMQDVNATIDQLKAKLLPPIPHLLSVPTSDPYRGSRPWETHRNSPFEAFEFDELQYMTLIPGDNRGVARPRGGWEDEINSRSPYNVSRSRSGTATPQQGERGSTKPRSRISLADYKSGKRAPKPSGESQQPAGEANRDREAAKLAIKSEPTKSVQNGAVQYVTQALYVCRICMLMSIIVLRMLEILVPSRTKTRLGLTTRAFLNRSPLLLKLRSLIAMRLQRRLGNNKT